MRKQFLVLMGAALLVTSTSGIVLPSNSAYASESVVTTNQGRESGEGPAASANTIDYSTMVLNNWLSKLDIYAAAVSGKDSDEFRNSLDNGATITTASGLTSSDLISKLTDLFAQNVSFEVRMGSLTEKEAALLQQQVSSSISELVSKGWKGASSTVFLHMDGSDIIQSRVNRIISDAAFSSEIGSIELRNALRAGKSLVEATGLDASTLSDALTALLNQDLDAAVKLGSLKADQLEQAEKSGAEKIWAIINERGYDVKTTAWMEEYGQTLLAEKLDSGSIIQAAAIYSDKNYSDLLDALASGQSLIEATGLASTDLSAQLLDRVNRDLENEWESGNLSAKLVGQLEKSAAAQINQALSQSGFGKVAEGSSNHLIAQESIRSIVDASANYMGSSVVDLRAELAKGQSLVEATLVDEAELSNYLKTKADSFINQAVQKGWLKASDKASTQTEAYTLVNDAINTRGYKVQVDSKQYLADRVDRIIEDVAAVSGIEGTDLLKNLAEGQSFAEAAKTDADSLLYKLLKNANQDINKLSTVGAVSEEDASVFKSEYASKVIELINAN